MNWLLVLSTLLAAPFRIKFAQGPELCEAILNILFPFYQDIKLGSVSPSSGPKSGGTHLAITGQYLNIGSSIRVFLDDLPCVVNASQTSSSRLMCVTSASPRPGAVSRLTLVIDGANRTLLSPYTYERDPTISEIKPSKSFISGGRMITVHGTNLNIIQKPEMIVYAESPSAIINKTVSYSSFLLVGVSFYSVLPAAI